MLREKFEAVEAPTIEHEDRLSTEAAQEVWNDLYLLFGATGEGAQTAVKVAIYGYYAVNGASQRTPHNGSITTSEGTSVPAADVLKVIQKGRLRKFLRSDVVEAYSALKHTDVLTGDDVFCAKVASEKQVPAMYAYCAVDFLRGCSEFTPDESHYAEKAFKLSIQRAATARRGNSIEHEDYVSAMQRAQGGVVAGTRTPVSGGAVEEF